jgi:hypothetical protein
VLGLLVMVCLGVWLGEWTAGQRVAEAKRAQLRAERQTVAATETHIPTGRYLTASGECIEVAVIDGRPSVSIIDASEAPGSLAGIPAHPSALAQSHPSQ